MSASDDSPHMRPSANPTAPSSTSRVDVMGAARRGEGWAFDHLFHRLARPLRGFAAGRGAQDPEGTVNEVLAEAFRSLPEFHGDEVAFRAFAFHIARRRLIDGYRRAARRPRLVFGDVPDSPAPDGLAAADATRAAVEMLAHLTTDQRDVILLRVVADLSLTETATVLDKPISAVKALQRRALDALRRRIPDQTVSSEALATIPPVSVAAPAMAPNTERMRTQS